MKKDLKDLNTTLKKDLTWFCELKLPSRRRFWFRGMVFLLIMTGLGIFLWPNITDFFKTQPSYALITEENLPSQSAPNPLPKPASPEKNSLVGGFKEPKNILLAGIPGQGNSAPWLTDTLMLANIQPDKNIFLFSFPRDLLVMPPEINYYTKINNIFNLFRGQNEDKAAEKLREKIAEISGIQIDNYLIINLSTLRDVINFVGGVRINSDKDIYDSCFPGPNSSCLEFFLPAGQHLLDGETALKYIRSRHSTLGDFDRIKRQQEVLLAIKNKVAEQTVFENMNIFLENAQRFFSQTRTDLSLLDLWRLWQTVKNFDSGQIQTLTISNQPDSGLLQSGHFSFGNGQVGYVLTPKAGLEDYSAIQKFISETIDQTNKQNY